MNVRREHVEVTQVGADGAPARGATIPVRPDQPPDPQVQIPEAFPLAKDRVRWGPIWAGLVTALTTMILLGLLGVAIGLTTVNAGTAAAQGGPPPQTGMMAAIWAALTGIIAFLLGGFVAGRTAAVFDRRSGAWNGALVFLLAIPLTLWLATSGLGMLMGTLGNFAGALNIDPSQIMGNAQGAANQAAQNVQPIDAARTAEAARNGAWGTLLGLLLGLAAAAIGGALGTRREVGLDQATGQVTRG